MYNTRRPDTLFTLEEVRSFYTSRDTRFPEIASLIITKLGWSAVTLAENTGLTRSTCDRIIAKMNRKYSFKTVFLFCMGVPIGSAMALHLLASAGYWLNPWYNDSHLIHLLVLLEYQCKPRKLWYNLVEPFIDTM